MAETYDSNSVAYILSTYDNLSKTVEDKITEIATRRLDRSYSVDGDRGCDRSSFEEQYSYVANLVEVFTSPYVERFGVRLDAFSSDRRFGNYPLHESSWGTTLQDLIEGKNPRKALHASEIIDVLESHLEPRYLEFLGELLTSKTESKLWPYSPNDVTLNMESMKAALASLERKYGKNGRIILPPRPIKSISQTSSWKSGAIPESDSIGATPDDDHHFKPDENSEFSIQFSLRNYDGNPLAFFESHPDVYDGLSRTQLFKFDQGLYQSLRNADQLHLAIPEKRYRPGPGRKLTSKQIHRILKTFKRNGGQLTKTAEALGHSPRTVKRYVMENGNGNASP